LITERAYGGGKEHRRRTPRLAVMTYQDTVTHADAPASDSGALIPIIGCGILTLLWGAYTVTFVAHMLMMPLPG
jgi:hypothetical protein